MNRFTAIHRKFNLLLFCGPNSRSCRGVRCCLCRTDCPGPLEGTGVERAATAAGDSRGRWGNAVGLRTNGDH